MKQRLGWISCRETFYDSLEKGDVVIQDANIWENSGGLPKSGKVVGKITHGTKVNIVDEDFIDGDKFYKLSDGDISGWIHESFIIWNWSNFTFIGKLSPAKVCEGLDFFTKEMGVSLTISENNFAVVTEGDPVRFEDIKKSVIRFVNRIANALAPFKQIALQIDVSNWIEVPLGGVKQGREIIEFNFQDDKESTIIKDSDIETALSIISLMKFSPYFDLALNDFYQAIRYPQHALIFLARSIESVEKNFSHLAKQNPNKGKSEIMRDVLEVKKSDVEYVTKRANQSHRRHASSNARREELPSDELGTCFFMTSKILVSFAKYLELIFGNSNIGT